MSEIPVACTLTAPELLQRRKQLLERVFSRVQETRPRDDGCSFRFAADEVLLTDLVRLIELERHCCAFLRIGITVEPGGGPVWLDLTGPPGTREFLESELGVGSGQAGAIS